MSQTYLLFEALHNFSFTKFINIKFYTVHRSAAAHVSVMLKFHWKWSLEPSKYKLAWGSSRRMDLWTTSSSHLLSKCLSSPSSAQRASSLSNFQHFPPETNAGHSSASTKATLAPLPIDLLSPNRQLIFMKDHTFGRDLAKNIRGDWFGLVWVWTVEQILTREKAQ